jgi:hypothetical protein
MTNVYSAIMKAADHIERHPDQFVFLTPWVPTNYIDDVGCALGWIGAFAGMPEKNPQTQQWNSHHEVAADVLDLDRTERDVLRIGSGGPSVSGSEIFYARLNRFVGSSQWRRDAQLCATALRCYAERYHKPLPDAVVQIFNQEQEHVIES